MSVHMQSKISLFVEHTCQQPASAYFVYAFSLHIEQPANQYNFKFYTKNE